MAVWFYCIFLKFFFQKCCFRCQDIRRIDSKPHLRCNSKPNISPKTSSIGYNLFSHILTSLSEFWSVTKKGILSDVDRIKQKIKRPVTTLFDKHKPVVIHAKAIITSFNIKIWLSRGIGFNFIAKIYHTIT